ncbi:TDT family transporter [Sodalis sp. (in: enterobacteria)]|uniref:TDT family transporter n=1 Tax=Sodalis sp. (in: enterobacteria) TaxID=1898979 RepID=UPI003F2C0710
MSKQLTKSLLRLPTPTAGLALGIASLGACLEYTLPLHGAGQHSGALIATILLLALTAKFCRHPIRLAQDLQHAVIGSVVPTYAMGWMMVAKALAPIWPLGGQGLWLLAVAIHLCFLGIFIWHRSRHFHLAHMVPAWFVPPVGIIAADVAFPGGALAPLAHILLLGGMVSYAVMLPLMLYRFIFHPEIADSAKPIIAIMAAPASLSLAGYLSVTAQPSLLLCAILLGIALLMTLLIYLSLPRLLRLPFTPGFAAFTFPLAIGATALYKLAHSLAAYPMAENYVRQITYLADIEVTIATLVVGYVALRFVLSCLPCVREPADA